MISDERKLELDILVLVERDLLKEADKIHDLRLDLQEREKRYDTLKAWWIKLKPRSPISQYELHG